MQDPNQDTEWNDQLRKHGIIGEKQKTEAEITEEQIVKMLEQTIDKKIKEKDGKPLEDRNLDELDEIEDESDEAAWLQYRQQRISELKEKAAASKYGEVREISAQDYIEQVNNAGNGIYVVLHLYQSGIPLCELINQSLGLLAGKFPCTKFVKSVSTTCIANYPDKNVPTVFVYYEGNMKQSFIGPQAFGGNSLTTDGLEWMLSTTGAVETELEADPRHKATINSIFHSGKCNKNKDDSSDDDDDW